MNKPQLAIIFGLVILLVSTGYSYPVTFDIDDINLGTFTESSTDYEEYTPGETIAVSYSFKNTWASSHRFLFECTLEDEYKQQIKSISPGTIVSDTFVITAPSEPGNYNIHIDSSVEMVEGRWTSSNVDADIPITIKSIASEPDTDPEEPNEDNNVLSSVTIYSNVADVELYCNDETTTIGSSKYATITDLPVGEEITVTATKSGYEAKVFLVIPTSASETSYFLTMVATDNPEEEIPPENPEEIVKEQLESTTVVSENGIKIHFKVTDEEGIPLSNAKVIIGSAYKFTNEAGLCDFIIESGQHTIFVTADSHQPFTQTYPLTTETNIQISLAKQTTATSMINTVLEETGLTLNMLAILGGGIVFGGFLIIVMGKRKEGKK